MLKSNLSLAILITCASCVGPPKRPAINLNATYQTTDERMIAFRNGRYFVSPIFTVWDEEYSLPIQKSLCNGGRNLCVFMDKTLFINLLECKAPLNVIPRYVISTRCIDGDRILVNIVNVTNNSEKQDVVFEYSYIISRQRGLTTYGIGRDSALNINNGEVYRLSTPNGLFKVL